MLFFVRLYFRTLWKKSAGGGCYGKGVKTTIFGGNITATGANGGAGIGGGTVIAKVIGGAYGYVLASAAEKTARMTHPARM